MENNKILFIKAIEYGLSPVEEIEIRFPDELNLKEGQEIELEI